MREIKTAALVGLGAIGATYFSSVISVLPREDAFVIAEGDRAVRYREHGFSVNGKRYMPSVVDPKDAKPVDLLMIAVKYPSLRDAIELARSAVGPNTIILSLQNGITSEEIVGDALGHEHMLYSFSLGTDSTRTGDDTSVGNPGRIPFGEAKNDPDHPTERVRAVGKFFDRVGIAYETPEDMRTALWRKFMINVGINQTSAVFECDYSVFQRGGEALRIAISAMREVIALAACEGVPLTFEDIDRTLALLSTFTPSGRTSMAQDIAARRRTEVDIFGGSVIDMGRRHQVPTPVNDMLVRIIRAKEELF